MAPLEINVTGAGNTLHPAERAILILQAQSNELSTAAAATKAVSEAAAAIQEAIAPHCPQDESTGRTLDGAAVSHYSMSTLETSSHNRRRSDERDRNDIYYSARAEFHIKFADFSVLNTLATRFSAMQHVKIQRIDWCLTEKTLNSIKGDARRRAGQDAIQRAHDYADVFVGVPRENLANKVRPVNVKESDYYGQSTKPQLHCGKGLRGRVIESGKLQFQPEDVRLQVKVDAKFIVEV